MTYWATFFWVLAILSFIGAAITSFSIFLLRSSFAKRLGTTFPFIEDKMKEFKEPESLIEYECFKIRCKKRKHISTLLVIAFFILSLSSMLANNL
tara:strand:- start:1839 stop:2123 length:285 start_codon:yes stop_codon:yes gene_type:complete